MKNFRVFFQCKPGNHWRACSDVVQAKNKTAAIAEIQRVNYRQPIRGKFTAQVTTDAPCSCWTPQTWRQYAETL